MLQSCRAGHLRRSSLVVLTAFLELCALPAWTQVRDGTADALLAIDQHRASVVERIVTTWGAPLAESSALVSVDELRTRLEGLRADQLLAASLAETLGGLRQTIGVDMPQATKPGLLQVKSLGDTVVDDVYTPVTPCRLVETRGVFAAVYQGDGSASHIPVPFTSNQIRTYTVQGANGVCLTQLPGGLNPSAVQLQVFGMPTTAISGDIEILPQGAAFGSTATMVYIASIPFNTVSTAAKINTANNQISVQVRGGGANVAIDVVGYFAAPRGSGGKFFMQGGNTFDTTANLGTLDNQPLTVLVDNQPSLRLMPFNNGAHVGVNVINGSAANGIASGVVGATIAGGGDTGVVGNPPSPNQVTGEYGTIGGGISNTSGVVGTVGGGTGNAATGGSSSIGGGASNTASGALSTVGGGQHNTAGGFTTTIAGGNFNTAAANYSVIAGGQNNAANGSASAVGGGHNNTAGGDQTAVGGGEGNTANGVDATVGGGAANRASGAWSTIPGGNSNTASGPLSVAAGFHANADAQGCFAFSDSSSTNVTSCFTPNVFVARALSGFYFYTGGVSDATYTGAQLPAGASAWTTLSDRNSKENIAPVDPREVLDRLAAMPIATWNWKSQDASIRHMGPMAQDFYAGFSLGNDDRHIMTVDAEGVALAAIQGLHAMLEERMSEKDAKIEAQQQAIAEQQREVAELRERLSRVESLRSELDAVKRALPQLESGGK
jgi:hypothetical protein